MARNRTGLAPWSLAREAGIESATVDGRIEVPQYVQPTLNTGFVDEKGDWKGAKSNDKEFRAFQVDESVGNGGTIITPSQNPDGSWPLDMTGYNDIFIAIKPTNAGNCSIQAVMGPADVSFANLKPVDAAAGLRGNRAGGQVASDLLFDTAESLTADVWNILFIGQNLKDQKLLQFKIVNNSGGASTIETAYMRLV